MVEKIIKNSKKITEKEIDMLCKSCVNGSCCRDGVVVDLEEAKKISQLKLNLAKPWFEDFFFDKDLPSKWGVSTVVRNGRCVFQKGDSRCRIYEKRPLYCRDFPIEHGDIAEFFHYLCEKPRSLKINVKKKFYNSRKRR